MFQTKNLNSSLNLVGKLVVSTPHTEIGTYLEKSVISIMSQDENGTLGVIVNRPIKNLSSKFIFQALGIKDFKPCHNMLVHFGGPIESDKGLVLHSNDYESNETIIETNSGLVISSNISIIRDISHNIGPKNSLFALGYVCWKPGELEKEIANNQWLIMPYTKNLIFQKNDKNKWNFAINTIGFQEQNFVSDYGHA